MKKLFAWSIFLAGIIGGWAFLTSSALVALLAATSGIVLTESITLGHLIVTLIFLCDWIMITIAAYAIHPLFGNLCLEISLRIPYICYWFYCVSQNKEAAAFPSIKGNGSDHGPRRVG